MGRREEFQFAEVIVDRFLLESFPSERSAYYRTEGEKSKGAALGKFRNRLRWHINNSLSSRQKEVMRHYLSGKKEREIAHVLGVTQQVVNIYKHRAIKKLQQLLVS
jgi:RNA polymerase sigma factor (sigma-70 family)